MPEYTASSASSPSGFFNSSNSTNTQESDSASPIAITLSVIFTLFGFGVLGLYFYAFCLEQGARVSPRVGENSAPAQGSVPGELIVVDVFEEDDRSAVYSLPSLIRAGRSSA